MGSDKKSAGIILVIIIIYFTLFTLIVNAALNISSSTTIENTLYDTQYSLLSSGFCSDPRYSYDASTGERYEMPDSRLLDCASTAGVLGKDYCERLEGCAWDNVTSTYWFFWETTGAASCVGVVNGSYYNISTVGFNNQFVEPHENTDTLAGLFGGASVCNHPEVIGNKTLCSYFDCTFNNEAFNADVSYKGIWSTVAEIFTFSYDFGFENSAIVFILNFIFIVIPLFILLIALYALLPFI